MDYIGKFIANFKDAYNEINGATLTGAIDAVVVRQEDGSFVSSPFHVRFGKIGVLRSREKVVDIEINGEAVDIHMKLGETGEAFFVEPLEEGDEVCSLLGTSPIPNYIPYSPTEDDLRSLDSGVEAEEVVCKTRQRQNPHENAGATRSAPSDFGRHFDEQRNTVDPTIGDRGVHPGSSSPCMDVPRSALWREDLVRSKSLSSVYPDRWPSGLLLDGPESKTDVEEVIKMRRGSRRRRKKRTNSKKRRLKCNDSQSSDNSTTSEVADIASFAVSAPTPPDPIFLMDDVESILEDSVSSPNKTTRSNSTWSNTLAVSMGPDFHPFSDTDISPPPSPNNSRSGTPVKSDTEYECEKQKKELSETSAAENNDAKWSWTWGELPTPPVAPRSNAPSRQGHAGPNQIQEADAMQTMAQAEANAHRSMLGNMFSFMRATKKARHNPESEGIYLDDLNLDELEPEVAALYFPRNSLLLEKEGYSAFRSVAKDDDVESGNGTSLPQSPHSVEGAIGGAKLPPIDSDFEEASRHPIFDYRGYHDLAFSLCGALHEHVDGPFPESLFLQSLVTYDDFCENPDVMGNPNLVVRLGGKYMNWATAAPQIMSLVLFQRPLSSRVIEKIVKENMPKKEKLKRTESRGYSWFNWGRHQANQATKQNNTSAANEEQVSSQCVVEIDGPPPPLPTSSESSLNGSPGLPSPQSAPELSRAGQGEGPGLVSALSHTKVTLSVSEGRTTELTKVKESPKKIAPRRRNDSCDSEMNETGVHRRYKKTIRLSSDQINKLNLRNGSNKVVFSVTTAYQGTTRCQCHIFLWNYDEKIVVSDIDGTITKSDVLGHILPIIGKDWAQGGVAQLFSKIKNNGYNFLYLSARAIGQARITRDYLRSIKQGNVSLPDGPLLLNPTSLIQAFHREVIEKKPEEFKISCLRDIKALFPATENPFYAGYGNRVNDVWAYSAVGIPIQRIFTINHRGELKHELTQTFQTTYSNLTDIVNHMFPAAHQREIHDEFSSMQFWRPPLPDLTSEIERAISGISAK